MRLDRRRGAKPGAGRAGDADSGRGAAHRRHDLLSRGDADPGTAASGAGAQSGDRRGRRGAGDRAAGSRPHDLQRLRHARAHDAHRLDTPRARHRRAHGDGRRQLRCRPAAARAEGAQQGTDPVRHGPGGRRVGRRHQCGAAGRAGGLGPAADSGHRLRGRDPPRRQVGRYQSCRLRLRPRPRPRRARAGRARASQAAGGGAGRRGPDRAGASRLSGHEPRHGGGGHSPPRHLPGSTLRHALSMR